MAATARHSQRHIVPVQIAHRNPHPLFRAVSANDGQGTDRTSVQIPPFTAYLSKCRTTTPPTFLVATRDDTGVPPQNAVAFYQAMLEAGVDGELHVWEKGGHGFGMLPSPHPVTSE